MATKRHVTVTTPLDDELLLFSMHGSEPLSRPFQFDLQLLSENSRIESAALLGKNITVHLEIAGHAVRHFNGIVTRFAYGGEHGRYFAYRVTMRPWLWMLDLTAQNDVYQRITIPELAHLVFRLNGFTDVSPDKLTGTYQQREYVLQYHESAFNFVTRWLEHEGIYYYFEHDESSHKICLADTSSSGESVKSYDKLPFRLASQSAREARDHFSQWHEAAGVAPESYALDAFDFQKPKNDLFVHTSTPDRDKIGSDADFGTICDASQNYVETSVGETYSRVRAEELRSSQSLFEGSGNVRGLRPGALFELTDHPRKSLNRKYYVVGVFYSIQAGDFESKDGSGEYQVHTNVQAIDASVSYRPPRTTHTPTVTGPETATVVGASETEIYSEELGRIKIQFHWDHGHDADQGASCWVRVAQPWAGTDFGVQFIPRIGQEVLVDFIAGDPDRPIVVGSVYNQNHKPPFPPNKHPTQSGIRTRSSKGGGVDDYNELRFEDDAGHEEVYLQAQRNLRELVKNDHSSTINGKQTNTVEKDQVEDIHGDQSLTVKGNRTAHVCGSQSTTIDGGSGVDGCTGCKLKVTGDYQVDVSKTITVQAPVSIRLECGGSSILIEPDKISILAGGQAILVLDTGVNLQAAGGAKLNLDTGALVQAALGGALTLDANAAIAGLQSMVSGKVMAQVDAGANSVVASPAGVALTGTPMVKIN